MFVRQDAYELKITFMGHANMRNIVDQIKQRQKDHQWPFEVQFLTTLVHHQAIEYVTMIYPQLHSGAC